eukprot:UN27019
MLMSKLEDRLGIQKGNSGDFDSILKVPIFETIRQRLPWLMVLLLFQSVSAIIMHGFDKCLQANLVVAFSFLCWWEQVETPAINLVLW